MDSHVVPFVNLDPKQMDVSILIRNSELPNSCSYLVNVPITALMKRILMMAPFCTKTAIIQKKWHPKKTRCNYEKTFSIANWNALRLEKKQLHTLAKCKACHHRRLQDGAYEG